MEEGVSSTREQDWDTQGGRTTGSDPFPRCRTKVASCEGDSSTLEISIITFLLLIPRLFTPRTLPAARPSNNGHVDACPELRCFAGLSPMLPAALQELFDVSPSALATQRGQRGGDRAHEVMPVTSRRSCTRRGEQDSAGPEEPPWGVSHTRSCVPRVENSPGHREGGDHTAPRRT